jgi:phenylpropionate dioxygenase-like ring-hydroxylating dioxygenase large terminal subunit
MLRNQWYVVLESKEVSRKPIGVSRMGEKLVFWRSTNGKVNCAVDRCPHRGVKLSIGKLENDHLQCPFHGFEYNADGRCVYIPANGKGGRIPESLKLRNYPVYASKPDHWEAHYSRVIENQLDVVHLPFVHYNTIGRGNNTVVDGPLVRWDGDMKFFVYVFNRKDNGTPPRKPNEIDVNTGQRVHLEFIFPNLWQNFISEDVRVLAAFTPVDEDKTLLYLRFYQRFLRLPIIGKLFTQMAMPANVYIAHQDCRVVVTHQPQPSSMNIGEKLIQGDLPIIAYRKRREELKALAKT